MAKTLRVGLIGYGFMGKAHSNAWRQAPHFLPLKARVELHTICGRNTVAVQSARAQWGWQFATGDWREVVESPLIEIVDIATPNDSHAEIAIAAARAGKHVLCEKPMALDLKQADAMLAAVQKAKVANMVCHNYRRVPAIALAKKMIADGSIGQVYHFHARYAQDWLVDPEAPMRWKLQKPVCGSGAHGDINVHLVDLARYLVGELKEVSGLLHTFVKERPLAGVAPGTIKTPALAPPKPLAKPKSPPLPADPASPTPKLARVTVDDTSIFLGRFENGALANLEATRCAAGRKNSLGFEINGSKGSISFDFEDMNHLAFCDTAGASDRQGFRKIEVTQPGGVHPYMNYWWKAGHPIGYEHTFIHTIADFVNSCVDGKPAQPTFEEGLKNQRVLHAVEKSAESRRWVEV
jgi:predicted dehydrogenase